MAIIMRFQGKFDEAEGYLSQAEQHEVDVGQRGRLPAIYQAWGDLKWDMNQLGWASKRYEQALSELDKLQEHAGHEDGSQRLQRERLQRRLDGLSRTRDQYSAIDYGVDEQPTRVWLEWRQVTRRLIQRLDRALWETAAVSVATRDMSVEWLRELAAFEALDGHRVLAQDTLSLSLVNTLPENQNTHAASARFHRNRYDTLHTRVHQWSADDTHPAAHDICCRPTVEGAMSDPYQRARALGALDLLDESMPQGYRLEAGLFSLPLGFAVNGDRILIELPPQTIRRYKMGIQDILGDYGSARQFCFRLDDHQLADELRALFDNLADLARLSTLSTVSSEQHEESTRAWLVGLLKQWDPPAVSDPINPAI
jgi:hypothetical protein